MAEQTPITPPSTMADSRERGCPDQSRISTIKRHRNTAAAPFSVSVHGASPLHDGHWQKRPSTQESAPIDVTKRSISSGERRRPIGPVEPV